MSAPSTPGRRKIEPPRDLTPEERRILERLLSYAFPGGDELREQLVGTKVDGACTCGCPTVDLLPERSERLRAPVRRQIPIEATGRDTDGGQLGVLLHVIDGYLSELEIYSPDGQPICGYPEPDALQIFSPELP
jgi:hypothetical protein